MELALITVNKIIEMFLILMIGVILIKTGVSDGGTGKRLSAILMNAISPCMIIMSYQIEFEQELLIGLVTTMGLSFASFALVILLASVFIKSKENPNMAVERMSIIYSNCGFIGIPLINGLIGSRGVFYMTAYILTFHILIWSHGVMLMSGKASNVKEMVKNLMQPSLIAIAVSLIFFVGNIRLPKVIANPMTMIGDMNTPVAMLVAGMNLAESDILGCLKRSRTYRILVLKLFAAPLAALMILAVAHANADIALTILVAAACPTGAMGTMFAMQYQKDSRYATELFTITTVLSLITIPVIVLAGSMIL